MHKFNRTQQTIAAIIYFIFGIIIFFLIVAGILRFFGAPESSIIWGFFYGIAGFFLRSFDGIYPNSAVGPFTISLEILVAITVYALISFLTVVLVTSVLTPNIFKIIRNIIVFVFRFAEAFLVLRFVFRVLAASNQSSFVTLIYRATNFIPNTLSILPDMRVGNGVLEFSTFFVLGVVVLLDIIVTSALTSLFGSREGTT